MNENSLRDAAHSALTEAIKPKICSISDSTGNIIKYNNKFYIVTCKHVANDFFYLRNKSIILKNNSRIYPDELKYIDSTNDDIDIALIEILNNTDVEDYFEEKDIEVIPDFREYNFENSFLFIYGFPYSKHFSKDDKEYITYISYADNLSKNKEPNDQFIYFEYDTTKERSIVGSEKLKTTLPDPKGLSGAFIFKIDRFEGGKNKIWHSELVSKAIAVQISWNKKNLLRGSNIKYLYGLLNNNV
jgi:hypothetical protein